MRYSTGVVLVLVGALCGSSAGLLVRFVEQADGWQILFYRSLAFSTLVFAFMLIRDGSTVPARFAEIGARGVIVAVCLGSAFIAYIFALLLTSVANAVFILSASPFIAALLARLLLQERITLLSWVCMCAGLAGVGVMMTDGILTGTLLGSLVAVVAASGYAASVVALRAGRNIDMMPATCLAGAFAALVSVFLVQSWDVSVHDLTVAILLGTVQIGLQYIFITLAAKAVPAAEITLLMLLEVVAAPVWVWLIFAEVPAVLTLIGGGLVLLAVALQAANALYIGAGAARRS